MSNQFDVKKQQGLPELYLSGKLTIDGSDQFLEKDEHLVWDRFRKGDDQNLEHWQMPEQEKKDFSGRKWINDRSIFMPLQLLPAFGKAVEGSEYPSTAVF